MFALKVYRFIWTHVYFLSSCRWRWKWKSNEMCRAQNSYSIYLMLGIGCAQSELTCCCCWNTFAAKVAIYLKFLSTHSLSRSCYWYFLLSKLHNLMNSHSKRAKCVNWNYNSLLFFFRLAFQLWVCVLFRHNFVRRKKNRIHVHTLRGRDTHIYSALSSIRRLIIQLCTGLYSFDAHYFSHSRFAFTLSLSTGHFIPFFSHLFGLLSTNLSSVHINTLTLNIQRVSEWASWWCGHLQ